MESPASIFGVEVLTYTVMGNQIRLILRNRRRSVLRRKPTVRRIRRDITKNG